jgi:hypothetical protein
MSATAAPATGLAAIGSAFCGIDGVRKVYVRALENSYYLVTILTAKKDPIVERNIVESELRLLDSNESIAIDLEVVPEDAYLGTPQGDLLRRASWRILDNREKHFSKADHNEKLADALLKGFSGWAVTVYFYSALHNVGAVLSAMNRNPGTHAERQRIMRKDHPFRKIFVEYETLRIESNQARYHLVAFGDADALRAKQNSEVVRDVMRSSVSRTR